MSEKYQPGVNSAEDMTPESASLQERREWATKEFEKALNGSFILRDYFQSSEAQNAQSQYEFYRGLYDCMVNKVKTIAETLPSADELEKIKSGLTPDSDSEQKSAEGKSVSLNHIGTILSLLPAIRQMGAMGPIMGVYTKEGENAKIHYGALIDAVEENIIYESNNYNPSDLEDADEVDTLRANSNGLVDKLKKLPANLPG